MRGPAVPVSGAAASSIFGTLRIPTIPFSTQYRTSRVATFQPQARTPMSGTRLNATSRTSDVVGEAVWASRTARAITPLMIARAIRVGTARLSRAPDPIPVRSSPEDPP